LFYGDKDEEEEEETDEEEEEQEEEEYVRIDLLGLLEGVLDFDVARNDELQRRKGKVNCSSQLLLHEKEVAT